MYIDNNFKFIAVLNKKIELPKLLNAFGHISAGLVGKYEDLSRMNFLEYKDADNGNHPSISKYPFIVLSADNSNQLRTLRKNAIEQGIAYNDFTNTMLMGISSDEQIENTRNTKENDLEYFAVVLFGTLEQLTPITKKFSLYK